MKGNAWLVHRTAVLYYINDLIHDTAQENIISIPDDAVVIYHAHKNLLTLENCLQISLNKVNAWCEVNRMKMNAFKTKVIHINKTPNLTLNAGSAVIGTADTYIFGHI